MNLDDWKEINCQILALAVFTADKRVFSNEFQSHAGAAVKQSAADFENVRSELSINLLYLTCYIWQCCLLLFLSYKWNLSDRNYSELYVKLTTPLEAACWILLCSECFCTHLTAICDMRLLHY